LMYRGVLLGYINGINIYISIEYLNEVVNKLRGKIIELVDHGVIPIDVTSANGSREVKTIKAIQKLGDREAIITLLDWRRYRESMGVYHIDKRIHRVDIGTPILDVTTTRINGNIILIAKLYMKTLDGLIPSLPRVSINCIISILSV